MFLRCRRDCPTRGALAWSHGRERGLNDRRPGRLSRSSALTVTGWSWWLLSVWDLWSLSFFTFQNLLSRQGSVFPSWLSTSRSLQNLSYLGDLPMSQLFRRRSWRCNVTWKSLDSLTFRLSLCSCYLAAVRLPSPRHSCKYESGNPIPKPQYRGAPLSPIVSWSRQALPTKNLKNFRLTE